MTSNDFRRGIADYIAQEARPREKFGHQPRLYALTRQVGEGLEYDDDVVYAAVWLHDLGAFAGHRPEDLEQLQRWDHAAYSMQKAPGILERLGFPSEKIALVVEVRRRLSWHRSGLKQVPNSTKLEAERNDDLEP